MRLSDACIVDRKSRARLATSASPDSRSQIGDQAPNSSCRQPRETYQLSDFKGKQAVVVAWFPRRSRAAAQSSAVARGERDKIRGTT